MGIQEIKSIIELHASEIKKTFSVKEIGLFGSYVKGAERPESDVDILTREEIIFFSWKISWIQGAYMPKPLSISTDEQRALHELKDKISKKYSVLWMKLFGSKARGDFDKESDIDVAIALEDVDWAIEKDIYEICFYVGLEHNLLISPILYSKKEIDDALTRATPFFKTIEREGILL